MNVKDTLNTPSDLKRRTFLKGAAASLTLFSSSAALGAPKTNSKKVIWVMLRGGMDSLNTVIPAFDKNLSKHRKALIDPILKDSNKLDRGFLLHPSLKNMHALYRKKELLPVVATATPYRSRSHFDGQDLLETGKNDVDYGSGWVGRLLSQVHTSGIAIARSTPISLRHNSDANITSRTWYPSNMSDVEDDTINRLMALYENDELLSSRLQDALATNEMAGDIKGSSRAKFAKLATYCARLMGDEDSPQFAMLEMGGWDTHNNLVSRISRQHQELDAGIAALKAGLGKQWKNTVVVIASEFGRTVRVNGTKGTDHGTGSNIFFAGGAVKGGRVLGDWPGLAQNELYQNRDLQPTSDAFAWIATLLKQHLDLSSAQMGVVFPHSDILKEKLA